MNSVNLLDNPGASVMGAAPEPGRSVADLKPKGACWYCNQPLDNVRKFCNKTCADDYRLEEEVFRSDGR